MAYEVNAYGATPKVRNPLGVIGLTIITIGIYGIVWYYKVNKELKDFGRVYKDQDLADSNPTNSVLAIVPGFLLVGFGVWWLVTRWLPRRRAQAAAAELPPVPVEAASLVRPPLSGIRVSSLRRFWRWRRTSEESDDDD